jgi:drug/metabolite transporter (DMT)-like permease
MNAGSFATARRPGGPYHRPMSTPSATPSSAPSTVPALARRAAPTAAPPSAARTAGLTAIALLAFAGNSLLCRLALRETSIDAASFSSVRLVSGALMLALLVAWRGRGQAGAVRPWHAGSWRSALALFIYAAGFSFAYVSLSAATGALLLFGVVQTSMIGWGLWRGERLRPLQWAGLAAASAGLVWLLLPGLATPSLEAGLLMACAGVAWAVYTLRGRSAGPQAGAATAVTAGNFLRAAPLALALSFSLSALNWAHARWDSAGLLLALASGALASGLGYAVWYSALRGLSATGAAILQLTVPAIATAGGVLLLGEPLTPTLLGASAAVLGGVLLVILARPAVRSVAPSVVTSANPPAAPSAGQTAAPAAAPDR